MKKQRKRTALLLLLFLLLFCASPVLAASTGEQIREWIDEEADVTSGERYEEAVEEISEKTQSANRKNYNMTKSQYESLYASVKDIMTQGLFDTLSDVFGSRSKEDGSAVAGLRTRLLSVGLVKNIQELMKGVGACVILVYLIVKLAGEMQRGEVGAELYLRMFTAATIGWLLILDFGAVLDLIDRLGEFVVGRIEVSTLAACESGAASGVGEAMDRFFAWESFADTGRITTMSVSLNIIKASLKTIGLWIISAIVIFPLIGCKVILYTILIGLYVRAMFFPLAVADCVGEGLRSPGFAYMKKYFAQYLRVGMCFIVAGIGSVLVGTIMAAEPAGAGIVYLVLHYLEIGAVYFAVFSLFTQTAGLANTVMGV